MNMALRTQRGSDLPLLGRIVRVRKGMYICRIVFAASRRHYGDEIVHAVNVKQARKHMLKLYPTLKWRKR